MSTRDFSELLSDWEALSSQIADGAYPEGLCLDDYYHDLEVVRGRVEELLGDLDAWPEHRRRVGEADERFRAGTWQAPRTWLEGAYWWQFRLPLRPRGELAIDLRDEFGHAAGSLD